MTHNSRVITWWTKPFSLKSDLNFSFSSKYPITQLVILTSLFLLDAGVACGVSFGVSFTEILSEWVISQRWRNANDVIITWRNRFLKVVPIHAISWKLQNFWKPIFRRLSDQKDCVVDQIFFLFQMVRTFRIAAKFGRSCLLFGSTYRASSNGISSQCWRTWKNYR